MLTLAEDDDQADGPNLTATMDEGEERHAPGTESVARTVLEMLRTERRRSRIVVRSERRLLFLRQDEIDWVEAAGNYVRLHVRGTPHVLRQSMKNMETRLDSETFVRIHRSTIVNVDRVAKIKPALAGDYTVVLQDGTKLKLSRSHHQGLSTLLRK